MQQGVNYKGLLFENGISFNNWECVTHSVGAESELYDLYFGLKFSSYWKDMHGGVLIMLCSFSL